MPKLTSKQQNKLQRIKEVLSMGDLAIAKMIFELEDKIDKELPNVNNILERIKGDEGKKGKEGNTGLKGDRGKEGKDGKTGKDGKIGNTGKLGKDGRDGSDGVNGINGEDGKNGTDGSPDTAEEVVDKVQSLGLKIEDIFTLKEELDSLSRRILASKGGGASASNARIKHAFKHILNTEAPTGDIDGANTTYTVKNEIFAVFAFSLNGEVIPQIPNYTIAGKTITFSVALPAAYSGKDFEIKYIG